MPFWFVLVLFAATTILGQLFRPKASAPKAATLADLDFPTAEETRSIPKGYGTFLMKAPNVVSVTDFDSEPIKKSDGGLFGTGLLARKQTVGYRYYCGIEMALCYRIDALQQIIIDDRVAWTGNVTTDTEIYINQPRLFGGDDAAAGDNGGVVGYLGVHVGLPDAAKDPYLVSEYGNYTAHRGVAYVVWKGRNRHKTSGYLGNSANVAPWQFVAKFIPNNLPYGTYGLSNYSNINGGDANPAEVLYDVLRNSEYAVGLSDEFIDLESFTRAAKTFYDDGYGFSALWDTSKPCRQIIESILQLTDSVLYSDFQTGKLVLKPARADYDPDTIPHFTDDDIVSITSFTRGAWSETTNEVKVPFINRFDQFIQQTGLAQDLANQRIQAVANGGNGTVSTNIQHIGISNPTTAANIAQRDLLALTTPLAKINFQINLKAYRVTIGQPFKISTNKIKDHNGNPIEGLIMRSNGLKVGNPANPVIDIEAVEDLFDSTAAAYAPVPSSEGVDPTDVPAATTTHVLDELPYQLGIDDAARMWTMAARVSRYTFSFDTAVSVDNANFDDDDSNNRFTPTGLLANSYSRYTAAKDNSGTLVVNATGSSDLDRLESMTATQVQNGSNLALIVEAGKVEIIGFEGVTINGSGNYQLNQVWRGLMDTTPESFTTAARIWFFSYGDARSIHAFLQGITVYVKIMTRTLVWILDLSAAFTLSRVTGMRALRPYPPGNIRINGVYNGSTLPGTGDVLVEWSHRDRTRQGANTLQNAGTVGLEGGAFYSLKIFNQAGTLLRTVTSLTNESYTYTNAQETADNGGVLADALTFLLYTTRDGITSYRAQIRAVIRTGSVTYEPTYLPTGTHIPPPVGSATSIGGVPISGTPTGTNNTPVYNPTTGLIEWAPGAGGVTIREVDGTPSGVATTIEVPNGQLTSIGGGVYRITPLQGDPGAPGTPGADGDDGAPGSVWYTGTGIPGSGLGVDNDMYLRTNGDVYQKTAGSWSFVASIKGAQGDPGAPGSDAIGSGTFYIDDKTETYIFDDNAP